MKNTPSITTTTEVTASIFLDEHNLDLYLDEAKKLQTQHGSGKIGTISTANGETKNIYATGDEYLKKIKEIIQVAHGIMKGELLPDIFDRIGLKNGTFTQNQRITVFKSGIQTKTLPFKDKKELALCVTTKGTYENNLYKGSDRYDKSKELDDVTARLAITEILSRREIRALLSKNMQANSLTPPERYLDDSEIKPGCIYQEKDGKEYLFLGKIGIVKDDRLVQNRNSLEKTYQSIRITEKISAMIEEAESLEGFLRIYVKSQVSTDRDIPEFHQTKHRRKFIKETEAPFAESWYSITNDVRTWSKAGIVDYLFGIAVPNENGTGTVTTKYAIIV